MKIIILGPPASGKGTQSKKVAEHFQIKHISSGDLLRSHIKNHGPYADFINNLITQGKLVPDEVMNEILIPELRKCDSYVLDGYPRNLTQAQLLDKTQKIGLVVYISLPDNKILERMVNRRTCPKCNRVYNLVLNPPSNDEMCDYCNEKLFQREDDTETVVKTRIKVYKEQTTPLLNYYEKKGLLKEVDGDRLIEVIFEDICALIENL